MTEFVKLNIKPRTLARIKLLANVYSRYMADLVDELVDQAWQAAKHDGLVPPAVADADLLPCPEDARPVPVVTVKES